MPVKRSARFFLLGFAFLLFMNSAGLFVFSYAALGLHRLFTGHQDERYELVLHPGELKNICWVGSHDFMYKGEIFDLESFDVLNNKIRLTISSDQTETGIKNKLGDYLHNLKHKHSPSAKTAFKLIPIYQENVVQQPIEPAAAFPFAYVAFYLCKPAPVQQAVTAPPPKATC
jgi:hypothetical protein